MTVLTPTTELEAVNAMLATIGEAPVNSLSQSGLVDAVIAYAILSQTTREVLQRGWDFNTEYSWPIPYDSNGKIAVPSNCLKIAVSDSNGRDYDLVQRGQFMYDRRNQTFVFSTNYPSTTIKFDWVGLLTFTDLPEAARYYILVRAGRVFLDRSVGSSDLHGFSQRDEMMALAALENNDADTANYNLLTDSYSVFRVLDRQYAAGKLINP